MTVLGIVVTLIVIGLLLYLVQSLPMDATVKTIIKVVVILAVVLWLAESLGFIGPWHLGATRLR